MSEDGRISLEKFSRFHSFKKLRLVYIPSTSVTLKDKKPLQDCHILPNNTKIDSMAQSPQNGDLWDRVDSLIEFLTPKKRKVIVESLTNWSLAEHDVPPLILDKIPNKNDTYGRFKLVNYSSVSIILKDIYLENEKNQRFELKAGEIRPNGHICIALKGRERATDLMPDPQSFQFSFLNTETLLLCDKYGEQIQLFPDTTSLAHFKKSPLRATPINDLNGSILGFLIENNCGREINLTQHYLRNERATFNKQITNKKLANNGKFRILTDTDDEQDDVQIYTNDIVVSFEALNGNIDDKLLLVDGYNNQFVLYTFTASKRKILNLCELPPDILCHIILFGDIEDYMFGIIQTSKRMHQEYSPYNKPFIIKQLIYNQGTSDLLGVPFLTSEQWVQ